MEGSLTDLQSHITRLNSLTGLQLYAVGGCVRDCILSRRVNDYDFTCNTPPDDIEEILKNTTKRRVYTIGKRFGTLAFKDEHLGMVEITTFRGEKYEPGNRKPTVEFVENLHNDLSRRDFTMNAMALDEFGTIHDPFHGQKDLETGIIRCVGDPTSRFSEDPLRMLRAIRFAATLGYSLDEEVVKGMQDVRIGILTISKERIVSELNNMFSHDAKTALGLLNNTGLLQILFTEWKSVSYNENKILLWDWLLRESEQRKAIHVWNWLLLEMSASVAPEDANIRDNKLVYKDMVEKYALFYKLSNKMKEELLYLNV